MQPLCECRFALQIWLGSGMVGINFTSAPLVSVLFFVHHRHNSPSLLSSEVITLAVNTGSRSRRTHETTYLRLANYSEKTAQEMKALLVPLFTLVNQYLTIQVRFINLSTFKRKPLPDLCLQKKILVDKLARVDFHEGSVSHKLIATKATVIGLKVPKS